MTDKSMLIETQVHSLISIIENLKSGEIKVPPFQRNYVWNRDNIKDLFDSIKKGYPIGSIIIWKPKEKMDWNEENTIGAFDIAPAEIERNCYILDGYQRLSTLFCCLTNPEKYELAYNKVLYSQLFELYYNLEEDTFEYARVKNKPTAVQIPVYVLLSTSDFRQYSRKNIEPNVPSEKLDLYLNRADVVSRQLIDYKISFIEINNANIEDAVDIFSRINSKGTDISLDWMVNALSYKKNKFRFADIIDSLIEKLNVYNFGDIKRDALFRCIQSSFGKLYIDQSDIETLAKRIDFADVTNKTIPFILKAVNFLHNELHVVDYKLLPYNVQIIFVMEFFRRLQNPSKKQLEDLKRWFWITSYSNYFSIYSLSSQRKAYNQFIEYLNGKNVDIVYSDDGSTPFLASNLPETIRLANVRSKALVLFFLNQLSFDDMGKVSSHYPLRLCPVEDKQYNSTENFIFLCDESVVHSLYENNNKILSYLIDNQLCKKYFITDEFINSWKHNDYATALKNRKKTIIQAEKKFVESLSMKYDSRQ